MLTRSQRFACLSRSNMPVGRDVGAALINAVSVDRMTPYSMGSVPVTLSSRLTTAPMSAVTVSGLVLELMMSVSIDLLMTALGGRES